MEPIITLSPEHYLYKAPTEPVVLAPIVEPVDLKQQQIDSLTEQLSTLANQFSAYIQAVHGTQQ